MQQLLTTGKVQHAYLGITGTDVTQQLASVLNLPVKEGALVQTVQKGSPADQAGVNGGDAQVSINGQRIQAGGDIITAVDGNQVQGMDDVVNAIADKQPGDKVSLTLQHGDSSRTVSVTLGDRPTNVNPPARQQHRRLLRSRRSHLPTASPWAF